jgi:hypothetical protein
MKRLLNVGGGSKSIQLPLEYDGYEHLLLDIDPAGKPDIILDGRKLIELPDRIQRTITNPCDRKGGLRPQLRHLQPRDKHNRI